MSRRISLRSTIFTGGMQMPSSNASFAEPQNDEGVMPPMFGQTLTAKEYTDLVAFLLTLK